MSGYVLERLRAGINANGCLCLSSRCPIHGESTGLLASAYLSLAASERVRRRLAEALRELLGDDDMPRHWNYDEPGGAPDCVCSYCVRQRAVRAALAAADALDKETT